MSYIFSRDTASVEPDWGKMAQSGATVALNAQDPHLGDQIAKARQAGAKFAIWIPAATQGDPAEYGKHMAALVQYYKPDAILPNIEQQGEGAQGSAWSHAMMQEFSKYVAPGSIPMSVVVEPNKPNSTSGNGMDFFDYSPYLQAGGGVVAESFSGGMGHFDPQKVHDYLANSGVPEDKINILLAPGQDTGGYKGNFSAYTLDDMKGDQLDNFLKQYAQANGTNTNAPGNTTTSTTPPPATNPPTGPNEPARRPTMTTGQSSYIHQGLARLRAMGYTPDMFGLEGADPRDQWSSMSGILGAMAARAHGDQDLYQIRDGTDSSVAETIQSILHPTGTGNNVVTRQPDPVTPQPPAPPPAATPPAAPAPLFTPATAAAARVTSPTPPAGSQQVDLAAAARLAAQRASMGEPQPTIFRPLPPPPSGGTATTDLSHIAQVARGRVQV